MKKYLLKTVCILLFLFALKTDSQGQTAPIVSATNPTQNNDAVTLTQNVITTFSQTMNGATTAVNSAIRVIGNKKGSYSYTSGGSFSGGGTSTITYNPVRNFFSW